MEFGYPQADTTKKPFILRHNMEDKNMKILLATGEMFSYDYSRDMNKPAYTY